MRAGIAGLGRMGAHMARNLVRAGHGLTVWNRTAGKAETFAADNGCKTATTPRELADRTDVNGGVKTGHVAAQNQASDGAPSAMARALPR